MTKQYDPKEFEKKKVPLILIINQHLGYLMGATLLVLIILLLAVGIKWAVTYLF